MRGHLLVLAVLLSSAGITAAEPHVEARVLGEFVLDGEIGDAEWQGATLLHMSEANLIRQEGSPLSGDWRGPADLSGDFRVGYTATDLVLAGRVRDDVLTLNPRVWWAGDEIEIFLDLDPREDEADLTVYNADDYQIILFPPAEGRRFGVVAAPGRKSPGDGGFDGVRVMCRRLADEGGAYAGYTFEAAIPFANFPLLRPQPGRPIGFDLALSDADGELVQRTYMTWSGRPGLHADPSRFGRLTFPDPRPTLRDEPASAASPWIEPGLILLCALVLLFVLWRYRRRVTALSEMRGRTKLLLIVVFFVLVLLSRIVPAAIRETRKDRARRDLDATVEVLRGAIAEADREWILGGPETAPEPDRILGFLDRGEPLAPERFHHEPLWIGTPDCSLTEAGTSVIDYAFRLAFGAETSFAPLEPLAANSLSLVYRYEGDPAAREDPGEGDPVSTIRVVRETGETSEFRVRFGIEVFDHATSAPPPFPESGVTVAFRDTGAGTHSTEWRIPLEPGAPVDRILVRQEIRDGSFVVHGSTLRGDDGDCPLPMLSFTRQGVPTNLWQDRPRGSAVVLGPSSRTLRIPFPEPADRVWVFFAKSGPEPGLPPDPPGREMLSLTLATETGKRSEPVVLRNGIHLDPEELYTSSHPLEFQADLAFRWTMPAGAPLHRDAVALDGPGSPAVALEVTYRGRSEPVILAGLTLGRTEAHRPQTATTHLVRGPDDTYSLTGPAREALRRVALTWFRSGLAIRTTLPAGAGREAILGSRLPKSAAPGEAGPPSPAREFRALGPANYLSAFIPVGTRERDVLEVSIAEPENPASAEWAAFAFYPLLALFLLGVLLLVADLLARLTKLRAKLTLGFAIAALVPLLLLFLGLSRIFEREASRTESSALREQVSLVRAKFEEIRDGVRRRARALLEEESLLATSPFPDLASSLERTDEAVRRVIAEDPELPHPARVFLEDSFPLGTDRGPRIFPLGTEDHPFLPSVPPADDLSYRWSELVFGGSASRPVPGGRRTIAVEVPVGDKFLSTLKARLGTRFDLLLFSPRGYPIAGTLDLPAIARSRSEVRGMTEIRDEVELNRAPAVREQSISGGPCSVAYDILRSEDGVPAAVFAVVLPRGEFLAAREEIVNLFVLLGALILLLEVMVGTILGRRITDPLTTLSRGVRAVSKGRLRTRVGVGVADEIGTLAELFNRMTSELEHRIGELSRLNAAGRSLSGSLDRERVIERAVEAFIDAPSPPDGAAIVLRHGAEVEIAGGRRSARTLSPRRLPLGDGPLAAALGAEAPAAITALDREYAGRDDRRAEREALGAPAAIVSIPFSAGRDVRGAVLLLYDRPDPRPAEDELQFLSTMAQQVAIALENARLYKLAIEDPASGLFVHSYFLTRLREETDRAVAVGRPLSLLLIALDEVDRVYETYGPADGDNLLSLVVRRLRTMTREMHVLARADRSTVEMILPETGRDDALTVAREIRKTLVQSGEKLASDPSRTIRFRPSIALATCPDDARSAEFLLSEARRALYMAVTDRASSGVVEPGRDGERVVTRVEGQGRFLFRSEKILELLETVDRIAESDVPILVQGETGTGKEVLADLVHEKSHRRDKPLVKVNCAALPESLLESELFGYERGAFTGAERRKPGRFELADGGTIFLDEIGEVPPQTQVKLLRVLQDHMVERLGSTSPIRVDVRVIAATNRDLAAAIRAGRFREDLYFRLNVISLVVPPLRARREDIPVLADHFIEAYLRKHRAPGRRLSPAAMDKLHAHPFPGNVRELRNTIERALVVARGEEVQPDEIVFPEPTQLADSTMPATAGEQPAAQPGLNVRQQQLLDILSRRETITNREFADLTGISARTGIRDMNELIERGLLEKVGHRRGAVYRLRPTPGRTQR
ncbi:MAG: sigma 54-interacting transcriptional regulator [Planctomycetes bacterium]|nr:sigma 54-interacting transcriptional regulator [Planctomycetota bacterium]